MPTEPPRATFDVRHGFNHARAGSRSLSRCWPCRRSPRRQGRKTSRAWIAHRRSRHAGWLIRLDTLGGGHARIALQRGGGLTGRALGWPAFESGRVYFSTACYADASGCVRQPELERYRISTRTIEGADAEKAILSHERDRGVNWLLIDEASGTDCQGDPAVPGGTRVLRGVQPAFR